MGLWWSRASTFQPAPGETLTVFVSEPGEYANLADFASRTILACSLVGYEVVAQSPPRSLAGLDRARWVAELVRQYAAFELPPPAECSLFALVEGQDQLELAISAGSAFVAFCWKIERDWEARHAEQKVTPDCGGIA